MRHNIVTRLDIKVIIATHTRLIKMKILLRDTSRKKFKICFFREGKQIVKFISKPILRIILCPISILSVPPEKKLKK